MPAADQLNLYVPFADVIKTTVKTADGIERPARIVRGVMTDETLDLDEQIIDYAWASKAAQSWFSSFGNIREQHDPSRAVGKGQNLSLDDARKSIELTAKIVDPDAIVKVDEQVLSGFSVGIKGARTIEDSAAKGGRIVGGTFIETSIVDHPCNTSCKFVVAKAVGAKVEVNEELLAKDWSQTPVLQGDEAVHNASLQAALNAIRDLITQELAEGDDQWDHIANLTMIANGLRYWAQDEAWEGDAADAEVGVSVLMAAKLADRAERATSIRNIAQALSAAKEKTRPMPEETVPAAGAVKAVEPEATTEAEVEEKAAEPESTDAPAADPEKAVEPDVAKDTLTTGDPAKPVGIGAVIDWALANGMPKSLLGGLLALAGDGKGSPPTDGLPASGSAGSFITDGVTGQIAPPALAVPKAATVDEVREIVTDTLTKFISSDAFLTQLAKAGEAKVAAAEATDLAKAAGTDLTTKVAEVEARLEEKTASAVADLRKSLTDEMERIKALPQAPKAATGALPAGVAVIEKTFVTNPQPVAPNSMAPELVLLMDRAMKGDWKAAQAVQKHFTEGNATGVPQEVLQATYSAERQAA